MKTRPFDAESSPSSTACHSRPSLLWPALLFCLALMVALPSRQARQPGSPKCTSPPLVCAHIGSAPWEAPLTSGTHCPSPMPSPPVTSCLTEKEWNLPFLQTPTAFCCFCFCIAPQWAGEAGAALPSLLVWAVETLPPSFLGGWCPFCSSWGTQRLGHGRGSGDAGPRPDGRRGGLRETGPLPGGWKSSPTSARLVAGL